MRKRRRRRRWRRRRRRRGRHPAERPPPYCPMPQSTPHSPGHNYNANSLQYV